MASLGRSPGAAPLTSADIPDNSITAAKIVDATIVAADLAPDSVDSSELVDGSVDLSHMSAESVDSDQYVDASIDTAHIGDDQVTGAKIENNPTIAGNLTVSGDIVPSTPLSHRNMMINGALNVAQRGTSSTSALYQTVDRWRADFGGTGIPTVTQSQQDISSGNDAYNAGFRKSYRVALSGAGTTSSTSYCHMNYPIEAQDLATSGWQYTSSSSYITLSFYVKVSTAQEFKCSLITQDGTSQVYTFAFTPSGTSWERIEHTIPGNSSITIDNNNGAGMVIYIFSFMPTNYTDASANNAWKAHVGGNYATDMPATWFEAGASTLDITGVQLELGSNATPFEHRSYGDELQRCERYCKVFQGAEGMVIMVGQNTTTTVLMNGFLAVPPRATPTLSIAGEIRMSDHFAADVTASPPTITANIPSGDLQRFKCNLGSWSSIVNGRWYGPGDGNGTGSGNMKYEMEL